MRTTAFRGERPLHTELQYNTTPIESWSSTTFSRASTYHQSRAVVTSKPGDQVGHPFSLNHELN